MSVGSLKNFLTEQKFGYNQTIISLKKWKPSLLYLLSEADGNLYLLQTRHHLIPALKASRRFVLGTGRGAAALRPSFLVALIQPSSS